DSIISLHPLFCYCVPSPLLWRQHHFSTSSISSPLVTASFLYVFHLLSFGDSISLRLLFCYCVSGGKTNWNNVASGREFYH
ncbi:hypothetical protein LEMLEM_LOCUS10276, partial [Lemmus lemmus]